MWKNLKATGVMSEATQIPETGRLWAVAAANTRGPWRFKYRKDATYHVDAYQPFVHSRCVRMNASAYWDDGSTLSFYNIAAAEEYKKDVPLLFWMSLPPLEFGNARVGAVVTVPGEPGFRETVLYMCTIAARITPVTVESTRDVIEIISSPPLLNDGTINDVVTWPQLSIAMDWAQQLNPTDITGNSTVIQNLIRITGMWESTVHVQDYYTPYAVESILAVMIVNGLARAKYGSGITGNLKGLPDGMIHGVNCGDWCEHMMPSNKQAMGDGGMIYDVNAEQQKAAAMFTMRATANGYAYSSKGPAAMLSIIILLTYSFIATLHYLYSVWSAESSNSWARMSEIVALALNSEKPKSLQNTGPEIETAGIFEQRVRVVAKGDHLEIAFELAPDYECVEKNVYYG